MDAELVGLIEEYSSNGRVADKEFYYKLCNILKKKYDVDILKDIILIGREDKDNPNLKKYLSGFESLFANALFDTNCDCLVVYLKNIDYSNSQVLSDYKDLGKDYFCFYNLLCVQTIIHEFEHIKQKIGRNDSSIESRLLRLLDTEEADTIGSYEYDLAERLAELKSLDEIIKLVKFLNIEGSTIVGFFEGEYQKNYLGGYHFEDSEGKVIESGVGSFISPTEKYAMLKKSDMGDFEKISMLVSDNDRVLYGLPISYEEYRRLFDGNDNKRL